MIVQTALGPILLRKSTVESRDFPQRVCAVLNTRPWFSCFLARSNHVRELPDSKAVKEL